MPLSAVPVNYSILILWAVWYVYWGASLFYDALSGKFKKVESRQSYLGTTVQSLLLGLALILVITRVAQGYYPLGISLLPNSTFITYFGITIAALGIVFSIWARRTLGNNWSGTVVFKKNQTLVKSGPYAIVRHPIYTGVSLGIIGSAIAVNEVSGIIAIASVILFSFLRISAEEKLMKEKFGKEYEDYSKHVKAFIPLIW